MRRRWWHLALILPAIVLWQASFFRHTDALRELEEFELTASAGVHHADRFVYFFYYLGLYPVALKTERPLEYSADGARRLTQAHGAELVNDITWTFRSGERGKVLLYLPDAWLKGKPVEPSLVPASRIAFVGALCGLAFACWWVGRPGLGLLLVVFLGSNPFQLRLVNLSENVFSWVITTAIAALALNLPLMSDRPPRSRWVWLIPALTGVGLATVRTVRSEPAVVLAAVLGVVLLATGYSWRKRIALAAVMVMGYLAVGQAWSWWFRARFDEATGFVAEVGGDPYTGPYVEHHEVWHPIWCGLGDFDTKYGYAWNDRVAMAYVLPILAEKYGVEVPPRGSRDFFFPTAFWGDTRYYRKLPAELPYYHRVVRDKVVADVTGDPLWYAGILVRRAWRTLTEVTPVSVAVGSRHLPLPSTGLLFIPVLIVLVVRRNWTDVKLVCFTLPTSATALLIYSGGGTPLYSLYHLVTAALAIALLADGVRWWRRGRGVAQSA